MVQKLTIIKTNKRKTKKARKIKVMLQKSTTKITRSPKKNQKSMLIQGRKQKRRRAFAPNLSNQQSIEEEISGRLLIIRDRTSP